MSFHLCMYLAYDVVEVVDVDMAHQTLKKNAEYPPLRARYIYHIYHI